STPHISTLSLHDALPISTAALNPSSSLRPPASVLATWAPGPEGVNEVVYWEDIVTLAAQRLEGYGYTAPTTQDSTRGGNPFTGRSEEHTSELQSRFDLVC